MKTKLKLLATLLLLSTINYQLSTAQAQGTAFTYQGRLNSGTNPANGTYDFVFAIYGSPTGTIDGFANQTNSATPVSNGLFTVTLNLGQPGIFTGPDRWLEIDVRTNGNGAFTTLAPRQKLTPTPYAITAGNVVSNGLAAGTYGSAVTFNNAGNSFSGNGSGLANVNALTLSGIGSTGFWQTAGNAGTTAGPNFLGTTDNQPLELQVNGQRALRIEPTGGAAPNLIGGYYQNSAGGFHAVAIAGGGTSASLNQAVGDYAFIGAGHGAQAGSFSAIVDGGYNVAPGQFSFIGSGLRQTNLADFSFMGSGTNNLILSGSDLSVISGGTMNVIQDNSLFAVISGGFQNNIGTNSGAATIAGGTFNTNESHAGSSSIGGGDENLIQSGSTYSAIAGGQLNIIQSEADHSIIGGGNNNQIQILAKFSAIGGGYQNTIQTNAQASTIGGGFLNSIQYNAILSTIGGGRSNTIQTSAFDSAIGGGVDNTIQANAYYSTIPGGYANVAGGLYSFAAGQQAQALHQGAFVWADSQNAPFASTANDQFLLRAADGVGINTANPMGNALCVNGDTRLDAQALGYNEGLALNFPTNMSGSGGYGGIHFHSTARNGAFDANSIKWGMFYNYAPGLGGIGSNGLAIAQNNVTTRLYFATNGSTTFYSNPGQTTGVTLAAGGGAWTTVSDRNAKENFQPVNSTEVLAKVAALPLTTWNYKSQDARIHHLGPMAQDFKAAFGLGESDTGITTVDADGVALAAIQGLNQKLNEKNAEIQKLKEKADRVDSLEKRLNELEQMVQSLAATK